MWMRRHRRRPRRQLMLAESLWKVATTALAALTGAQVAGAERAAGVAMVVAVKLAAVVARGAEARVAVAAVTVATAGEGHISLLAR